MSTDLEDSVYAALCTLDFDGYDIPDHTKVTLENYFYHKLMPGSFVTAILCGESVEYCQGLADAWNRPRIEEIQRFVREQMPSHVHGNAKAVNDWIWVRNG